MTEVNKLITDNIKVWTSALNTRSSGKGSSKKLNLIGIKKLRQLILELAVSGKLTQQQTSDTPVPLLLTQLEEAKDKLVKAKKIKKPKKFSEIAAEEVPYLIPNTWKWIRFGDCVSLKSGSSFPKDKELTEGEIPYCKVGDMNLVENLVELKTSSRFINPNEKEANHLIPGGSIAFPKRGGAIATNKKRFIYKPVFVDLNIMAATPFDPISINYVMTWLGSIDLAKLNTGTSVPQINNKDIEPLIFPCPPQEEQNRIVEKVEELMAFCDQLEQQTEDSIDAHQLLVEELLSTLFLPAEGSNSEDAQAFEQNWARIAEHFDLLFTTEHSIEQLKQTILQLAVMGKLVPQDPNDEPASALLKRIAREKEQLIKDKVIKKQKTLPPITDEEKTFDLPNGWEWTKLDYLAIKSGAGWSPQCSGHPKVGDNWGVLKVSAVSWGEYNPDENKELPVSLEPRPDLEVKSGDFLISRANTADLVAKAVVVPENMPERLMMSDKIIRFNFSSLICLEYIKLINNSRQSRAYYAAVAGGTSSSMKNVSREQIRNLVFAIPPINEQHRIVAKVDELIALCEQVKTNIIDAQSTQAHLAESIVQQALNLS